MRFANRLLLKTMHHQTDTNVEEENKFSIFFQQQQLSLSLLPQQFIVQDQSGDLKNNWDEN